MNRFHMERWIPKDSTPVTREGVDAIVYTYALGEKLMALGYHGRANRNAFHFRFQNELKREKYIQEFFDSRAASLARKNAERQERKNFTHNFKVGDILYYSWGYDQTNVEWFEIIGIPSPKSVTLRAISGDLQETGNMCGNTLPIPGAFKGESFTKRVQPGNVISMAHGCCSPWEFRPVNCSWYA